MMFCEWKPSRRGERWGRGRKRRFRGAANQRHRARVGVEEVEDRTLLSVDLSQAGGGVAQVGLSLSGSVAQAFQNQVPFVPANFAAVNAPENLGTELANDFGTIRVSSTATPQDFRTALFNALNNDRFLQIDQLSNIPEIFPSVNDILMSAGASSVTYSLGVSNAPNLNLEPINLGLASPFRFDQTTPASEFSWSWSVALRFTVT